MSDQPLQQRIVGMFLVGWNAVDETLADLLSRIRDHLLY
jgi:hypothetical protein